MRRIIREKIFPSYIEMQVQEAGLMDDSGSVTALIFI